MALTHVMVQTPRCFVCGKAGFIEVPNESYEKYLAGAVIQEAWPEAPAPTREQLISGTHPACWIRLVGTEPTS